jgi:hypothetical protein
MYAGFFGTSIHLLRYKELVLQILRKKYCQKCSKYWSSRLLQSKYPSTWAHIWKIISPKRVSLFLFTVPSCWAFNKKNLNAQGEGTVWYMGSKRRRPPGTAAPSNRHSYYMWQQLFFGLLTIYGCRQKWGRHSIILCIVTIEITWEDIKEKLF